MLHARNAFLMPAALFIILNSTLSNAGEPIVIGLKCRATDEILVKNPPRGFDLERETLLPPTFTLTVVSPTEVRTQYAWSTELRKYQAYAEYNPRGDYGIVFLTTDFGNGRKVWSRHRVLPNSEADLVEVISDDGTRTTRVSLFCARGEFPAPTVR